jgi:hypothetical protein
MYKQSDWSNENSLKSYVFKTWTQFEAKGIVCLWNGLNLQKDLNAMQLTNSNF